MFVFAEENQTGNETIVINETNVTDNPISQAYQPDIVIKSMNPTEFKVGDSQFSLQVMNEKNETLPLFVPDFQLQFRKW